MSRVIAAFAQFFNGDGTPLENGWLKFLNSNSNNSLKNTYADADQTIANANPLQLDAEGRCPNVFGQGVYRIELYTNNPVTHLPGALIQQFDPVYAEYLIEGAGGNFAEWDTDESYQVGSIVVYNGKYYRSFTSNNQGNMPDTATDEWEQIAFLRYWNADVTYLTDDIVISGSQLYFSLADANTGNVPPSSPTWWDALGSGTILLNWSESGTTFQPNASGFDLGSATNIVGDAWINSLGQFTSTPSSLPTLDYHIANKIYVDETAALRMRWMSDWVPGTYEINDVVMDDNWTMVAVAQTTDRPAPQPAGDNLWVRDAFSPPAFSETSDSQPALFIGQRYEFTPAFTVRSIRIWLPETSIGDNVEVWMVYNSTTDPRIVNILPGFTITSNQVEKWVSLTIGSQYVAPGSFIDFIMVIRPGTGPLTFTYEWDYFRTNGDPSSGQIYHQGGLNVDEIRIHEEDSSATDRTSQLNLIVPGSKITMDSQDYTWEVIQASKTGDVYTFVVDPAARAGAETSDFTFTYYSATPIYYVYNTDLYLSDSRISGYYATEYDPSNATYLNDNGYGIDIEVQNMISSDDWEVVAAPYGTVAGGSGSGLVNWEESDTTFRPVTSGDGQLGDSSHLISGLYLGDSSNIYVGDGQDLDIYHDGTNSYILNGTGSLNIGTSSATALYFMTDDSIWWLLNSTGDFIPLSDSTNSIGSTSLRILKLWADDIESTNVPTIAGGSFIDAAVPDQTGYSGYFLTTDGSSVSWSPLGTLPTPTLPDDYGKSLVVNDDGAGNPKFEVTEIAAPSLLINQSLRIAQIGESFQGTVDASSYAFDMNYITHTTSGAADFTITRDTDVPILGRSLYSYKVATLTQQSTVGTTDMCQLSFSVEGINISEAQYGTANAKPLVLSMWVKSTDVGTHAFFAQHQGTISTYPFQITINVADTWEFKYVVIDGDTANAMPTGEELAFIIYYVPMMGSTYHTTLLNQWSTGTTNRASATDVNLFANASGTFQIADMKLEFGTIPTSYIPRGIRALKDDCQRYFRRYDAVGSSATRFAVGYWSNTTLGYVQRPLTPTMRITPTLEGYGGSLGIIVGTVQMAVTLLIVQSTTTTKDVVDYRFTSSGGTANNAAVLAANADATAYIDLTARI